MSRETLSKWAQRQEAHVSLRRFPAAGSASNPAINKRAQMYQQGRADILPGVEDFLGSLPMSWLQSKLSLLAWPEYTTLTEIV